jgi:hypothetical protein
MAFLRVVRPAIDADLYDAITTRINVTSNHPRGLIMHAAGEANGSWHIVEVWDSEEYAQQFDAEILIPAIEAATGSPPPGDAPTVSFELHQLVTP